ncbi:MAG: hypothetical protein AB1711_11875 [Thermodesulfobacteriota bacterium]
MEASCESRRGIKRAGIKLGIVDQKVLINVVLFNDYGLRVEFRQVFGKIGTYRRAA